MRDMKKDFLAAIDKALNILGTDADVTGPQGNLDSLFGDAEKARVELNKARTAMIGKIQDYENALDKINNAFTSYKRKLPKEDFKLDEKKADDKKKIIAARKILEGVSGEITTNIAAIIKKTGQVDSAIENEIN